MSYVPKWLRDRRDRAAFKKWDEEQTEAKLKPLRELILRSRLMTAPGTDGRSFVNSCSRFLEKKHHLTEAQIEALKRVADGVPSYPDRDEYDGYDPFEDEYGLCEADFAGGLP